MLVRVSFHVSTDEFARIADAALESIPDALRDRMAEDNLLITIQASSDPEHVDEHVLGYYEGGHESAFSAYDFPKRIVLVQRHIERWSSSYQDLVDNVTDTVLHEVAHYFGMSHDDIAQTRLRH
jgi:predicted Zn-dependent protease with MMP-like domain